MAIRIPTIWTVALAVAAIASTAPVAAQAAEVEAAAPSAEAAGDAMVDSPMFKLGWPKIEMPKFSWKNPMAGSDKPEGDGSNPISRAFDKVADASKSASESVRGAWGSAMERLTGGGEQPSTQAVAAKEPGFWSRMFGGDKEEPQGAQTMEEFLAQERVGMTR